MTSPDSRDPAGSRSTAPPSVPESRYTESVAAAPSTVEPMIEASETYHRLAEAVAAARQTVHMAYWAIQPDLSLEAETAVRARRVQPGDAAPSGASPEGSSPNGPLPHFQADDLADGESGRDDLPDWARLVGEAAARGVTVRMILCDFDPLLVPDLHRQAWASYRRLAQIRDDLPAEQRGNLQIICSPHAAVVGIVPRLLAQPLLRAKLASAVKALDPGRAPDDEAAAAARARLADAVMLWPHLSTAHGRLHSHARGLLPVLPGAHHEKTCVVDGTVGFLGGLDIDRERFDTRRHRSLRPWHDIACRLTGPVTGVLDRHFAWRWAIESARFEAMHARAVAHKPRGLSLPPAGPLTRPAPPPDGPQRSHLEHGMPAAPAAAPLRVVRTLTERRRHPLAITPQVVVGETAEAVAAVIGDARRHLYIENQFLRSERVGDWLVRRARECPELRLICVLPLAPERLGGGWNAANRHGQYLQRRQLRRIRRAFGERAGFYTLLARRRPLPTDHPLRADLTDEDTALDSDEIYVHAKVMIADDETALVGSANLNERSLAVDTEAGVLWRDAEGVAAFRQELWHRHLGEAAAASGDPFDVWQEAARRNAAAAPEAREGFAVPMTIDRLCVEAKRSLFMPARLL